MAWQSFMDAARLVRYYEALSTRYRSKHKLVMVILAASAASGIAALLGLLPADAQIVISACVALVAIWLVSDYARKAAVLHTVSVQCSRLYVQYEQLWARIDEADRGNEAVLCSLESLDREIGEVTGHVGYADISPDERNIKTTAAAYKVMADQYAV